MKQFNLFYLGILACGFGFLFFILGIIDSYIFHESVNSANRYFTMTQHQVLGILWFVVYLLGTLFVIIGAFTAKIPHKTVLTTAWILISWPLLLFLL